MEQSTELIQTRKEPLRSQQVSIEQFNFKDAILYYSIYVVIKNKSNLSVLVQWLITISAVYSSAWI